VLRVEHVPLFALTLTAFAMGTAELIPNGLLPLIASDLGVAVSRAGWVTTCFALGVMVGGPALAACTMRVPRKPLVLGMTVVFLVANAAMTLATTLSWALALRFVAGSMLGGFLGLGITIAVGLVPAQRQATSIAVIFLGFTISNVLSVPLGNVVGRHSGWAAAFWVVVVLAALGLVAMWLAVPGPSGEGHSEDLGFGMLRNGRLWVHFVAMALGYGGVFALYTYIAPFLTDVAGFASGSVAWILLLFGIGVIAGNLLGGRYADRSTAATTMVILAVLAAALVAAWGFGTTQWIVLVLLVILGVGGFGIVPPMQSYAIHVSGASSTMVSALASAAFAAGIALGSAAGGAALDLDDDYRLLPVVGASMVVLALLTFAVNHRSHTGRRSSVPGAPHEFADA
jgi:DHA1 family inner membrane transport protein